MLRSGRTAKDLREHIDWFNGRFPHWRENAYIRRLPKCKQIFISFAAKKRYWISRALIFAWDTKQRLSFKKVEAKEE